MLAMPVQTKSITFRLFSNKSDWRRNLLALRTYKTKWNLIFIDPSTGELSTFQ